MTLHADTTFSLSTCIPIDQLPAVLKSLPPHCGHHVMDNGDGTVILSAWSDPRGNA